MDILLKIIEVIKTNLEQTNYVISRSEILAMLIILTGFVLYLFFIYKVIFHRALYNASMHLTVTIVPYFISAIIMCLQSDYVVTLGTIGALAIIRFRSAVKDPVDMIYILWSIFIGICCGCKLYNLCLYTSLFSTLVMLAFSFFGELFSSRSYVVIINSESDIQNELEEIFRKYSKRCRLKSFNSTQKGIDYVFEIYLKKEENHLSDELVTNEKIKRFSIVKFGDEDIL